ncbi:MAG: hypothetical protein GXO43_06310 [Crenarchaeota archaeon]|nr:hypothetical protein [Thermoproteota archaeon]
MRRLIGYFIAFLSLISTAFVLFNLFRYPVSIGRAVMYIFLLIPLILITLDLGLSEALSRQLDKSLTRRKSTVIQIIIVIVVFVSVMFWGMSFANSLFRTVQPTTNIGVMYPGDIPSIWISAIPIALFVVYYYITKIYEYMVSKHKQAIK